MTTKGRYRRPDDERGRRVQCFRCRTWIGEWIGTEVAPRRGIADPFYEESPEREDRPIGAPMDDSIAQIVLCRKCGVTHYFEVEGWTLVLALDYPRRELYRHPRYELGEWAYDVDEGGVHWYRRARRDE